MEEGSELRGNRVRWVDVEEMGEHTQGLPSEACTRLVRPELSVSDFRRLSTIIPLIISSTALCKRYLAHSYTVRSSGACDTQYLTSDLNIWTLISFRDSRVFHNVTHPFFPSAVSVNSGFLSTQRLSLCHAVMIPISCPFPDLHFVNFMKRDDSTTRTAP